MSDAAADFSFVGPAYEAPMLLQDAQRLINWYLEISGSRASKMPMALLGCPGLNPFATLLSSSPVRGAWVLPGGTQCLWVSGSQLWLMTMTVPATQTSIAQVSVVQVGTLLTNNGPVCIRDNGVAVTTTSGVAGGYALIVDGQYAYYYRIAGAGTFQFTGGVTSGSTTISLPGTLPVGLLMSTVATLSDSGNIPANTYISSINYSTPNITMSAAATGTNASETITLTIPAFGQLTDPGLPAAPSRLAFIEGWLLVNNDGTRTFQTNGPVTYTLTFPASFNALKDSSTDNLVTIYEHNREAWLIGEKTSEVWYQQGGQNFAFARIPGVGPQIGCAAKHSISRIGPSLIWLAKNEQGENMVVITAQYGWERISNHAVEHAISGYPLVSDAIGYAYEEEGHLFYVLTFPTADVTWCWDMTASRKYGDPVWHQRLSYDQTLGQYHRHRSNCYVDFQNLRLVGDYQTGQVHQMSRKFYTDAGNPLRCQRRTPHIWSREDRKRVFQSRLQIEFTPGVGLQTGQGSNPQMMLRWSDDGGFTWSNEHWASIGQAGQTKNRCTWNRLGQAWDRVYEGNFSDPVPRDIIGATLFGEGEEESEAA
jgi:hypothetical protein